MKLTIFWSLPVVTMLGSLPIVLAFCNVSGMTSGEHSICPMRPSAFLMWLSTTSGFYCFTVFTVSPPPVISCLTLLLSSPSWWLQISGSYKVSSFPLTQTLLKSMCNVRILARHTYQCQLSLGTQRSLTGCHPEVIKHECDESLW